MESIWDSFFLNPFLERSKSIVEFTFNQLFTFAHSQITRLIQSFSKKCEVENIAFEIWNKKLDGTEVSNMKNSKLLASPILSKLDVEFSSIIASSVAQLVPLMELQQSDSFTKIAYTYFSTALLSFQKSIIEMVREIEKRDDVLQAVKINMCSFVGKAAASLAKHLAPFNTLFKDFLKENQINDSFQDCVLHSRSLWTDFVASVFSNIIKEGLTSTDWSTCRSFTCLWENVEDSIVKSLPSHPSSFISKAIFYACEEINRLDSFSMEKVAIADFWGLNFNLMSLF